MQISYGAVLFITNSKTAAVKRNVASPWLWLNIHKKPSKCDNYYEVI